MRKQAEIKIRKHNSLWIIIPIALVLTLLPYFYLLRMPSMMGIALFALDKENWQVLFTPLKHKNITAEQPADGIKIDDFGISFTLTGDPECVQVKKSGYSINCKINEKKSLLLVIPDPFLKPIYLDYASFSDIAESAGCLPVKTDYDFKKAAYSVDAGHFSLFDNKKNMAVLTLLNVKSVALGKIDSVYSVDTGSTKGLLVYNAGKVNIYSYSFFSESDPNMEYGISFIGDWTEQEVDAVIATIQFDTQK